MHGWYETENYESFLVQNNLNGLQFEMSRETRRILQHATSNKVIPAKGSGKITYLLIRRILFACNNRDDNLVLYKRFALFRSKRNFLPSKLLPMENFLRIFRH